jgi:hypothetical protein
VVELAENEGDDFADEGEEEEEEDEEEAVMAPSVALEAGESCSAVSLSLPCML